MSQTGSGQVIYMFGPDLSARGGIASVASNLAAELNRRGCPVTYISTWVEGGRVAGAAAFLNATLKAGLVPRGAVVHVHMSVRGSFLRKAVILALAHARGARTIVQVHSGSFPEFVDSSARWYRPIVRRVFGMPDVVLALSEYWRGKLTGVVGRTDVAILPNPVRIPDMPADMNGPRKVLYLGRLCDQKGTNEMLDAIALLQARGMADVQWMMAGDGDLERFRAVADHLPCPERVEICDWLPSGRVWSELSESWLFCLPSHHEGQPVALLEAMASGLACVATDVGGIPDMIDSGADGLLVHAGDSRSLADAIEGLLDSRAECLRLGAAARAAAIRGHSIGDVINTLLDFYRLDAQ